MPSLCRDCCELLTQLDDAPERCSFCGSTRVISHSELLNLEIAHIDCDSFYASVEKRDNPGLKDKPVIIGGRHRGVVAAACYVARIYGVRSAMPMFKALKLCPDAIVISPNMSKYQQAGYQVRELMQDVTPLVQPLSIDEAFLDLSGTQKLHKAPPAQTLLRLIRRIETDVGVTASVGLSHNKFLAKIASDLDKPRGFALIGKAETLDFLEDKPVRMIWGVGPALETRLNRSGITRIGQLRRYSLKDLARTYGSMGERLHDFCRGHDTRKVNPVRETKSISSETTLKDDLAAYSDLEGILRKLAEKVARRLKAKGMSGKTVTLKLKGSNFRQITRSQSASSSLNSAAGITRIALPLLEKECDGTLYRLIGVGVSGLEEGAVDAEDDLFSAHDDAGVAGKAMKALEAVQDEPGGETLRLGMPEKAT